MEKQFTIKDKTIVITGATGILGKEYLDLFAAEGANIVFSDINQKIVDECLERIKRQYSDAKIVGMVADITSEADISRIFATTLKQFGQIDTLVNNAQGKPPGFYDAFENYSMKALRDVLDVNLVGVVQCSQIACKQFIKQGFGNIVNVASTYGIVAPDQRLYDGTKNIYNPDSPMSSPVSYAVSKAGVVHFTRYLASYYREKNIRVNCLTPGGVYDNHDKLFTSQYSYRTLLGRMANKDEYRGAMLFLCSNASSYMTGANLVVDGGWSAI